MEKKQDSEYQRQLGKKRSVEAIVAHNRALLRSYQCEIIVEEEVNF